MLLLSVPCVIADMSTVWFKLSGGHMLLLYVPCVIADMNTVWFKLSGGHASVVCTLCHC